MQITMPKLGLTMTHGTVTEWLRSAGDSVKAEEALCVYETEKVTLELVAPEDGVLVEILAPAGTTVAAGAPVCEFQGHGETQQPDAGASADRVSATPKARALAREFGVDLKGVRGSGPEGRVQASDLFEIAADRDSGGSVAEAPVNSIRVTPLARRMAAAEGIDLTRLRGSGVASAVTREDVEQAIRERTSDAGPGAGTQEGERYASPLVGEAGSAPGEQIIPHSTLRRTIADRMSQSAFTAPHVTLMTEAEATNLVSARSQLNQELPPAAKIAYNTLLAALVAKALHEYPMLNARWDDDGIHLLPEINIAIAVDTQRGLVTPVLRGVDLLSLASVQSGYSVLLSRALAGKSSPEDFAGGTFTITNLGPADIDGFTPIINPPQAAILGVGRIVEKPVARDGTVVIRPMLTLSLSFDHRIVDGGPAAKFLQRIKQLVERPMALAL